MGDWADEVEDMVLEELDILTMMLDEKGRCCGRKPKVYKGRSTFTRPHKYCPRCDRAYDLDDGGQISNWAWKQGENGEWYRQSKAVTRNA